MNMLWLKPVSLLLVAVAYGMMYASAQATPMIRGVNFEGYGLLGAFVMVVALFLWFLRDIGKSCHAAHTEDLKRIEVITNNLSTTLDRINRENR